MLSAQESEQSALRDLVLPAAFRVLPPISELPLGRPEGIDRVLDAALVLVEGERQVFRPLHDACLSVVDQLMVVLEVLLGDADLGVHEGQPAIVACHYPAIGIPERMRRPGMADAGCLENGGDLIAVLRNHPNVRAMFSGHLHMNIIEFVESVMHVTTSALPEFPTE